MKIALFSDSYLPTKSGIVTVLIQLRKALEALGHHVVIVTVETTHETRKGNDDDPNILRVPSVPIGLGTDQYFGFPRARKIIRFLKEHEIEIIHSHTEFYMGYAAIKAGKSLHIPVIASTHTMWEDFYDHYIPAARLIPVKAIRKLVKHLYRNFYAFINVSQKARDYFKSDFMLPAIPSAVIPNAVDTESFNSHVDSPEELAEMRRNWSVNSDDILLLFVGRVAQEKRVIELMDACIEVVSSREKVKAMFVGSGPVLSDLQKTVQKAHLDHKIILTGFVNWTDLHTYYHMSDIFLTASLSEMHSMTILEALLSGLPIIARRDSSYFDTVHPGRNGYLEETDESFTARIIELIDNPDLRKKYGEESKTISKQFTIETHGKKNVEFYRCAIESYPRKPDEATLRSRVESI